MTTSDMSRRKARSLVIMFGGFSICNALMAGVGSPHWYWIIPGGLFAAAVALFGSIKLFRYTYRTRGNRQDTANEPRWGVAVRAIAASSGVFVAEWIAGGIQTLFLVFAACMFAFGAGIFVVYAQLVSPPPTPKRQK